MRLSYTLFILSFVCVFNISCINKRNQDSTRQVIAYEKVPVTLDSTNVMKYKADELIDRNGNPISDVIFPIKSADPSNNILWHYLSRYSDIDIREQKWALDSVNYVVIWFTVQDSIWNPVLFEFRDIWTDY